MGGVVTLEYVQGRNDVLLRPGILQFAERSGRGGQILHEELGLQFEGVVVESAVGKAVPLDV